MAKNTSIEKSELSNYQKLFDGILPDPTFYSEAQLRLSRNLYCKFQNTECTDDEFVKFIYLAYKYKFDPVEGYIQCVKYVANGKPQPANIFLGKDALLAIVSRQKTFLGIQAGVFYRNPNVIVQQNTAGAPNEAPTYSTYKTGKNANPILYGYAIIYRSDRSCPIYVEVAAREYHRNNEVWSTKTETMIKKVAISQCCQMAYPEEFTGVFVAEEFDMTTDAEGNIIPAMPEYSAPSVPTPDVIANRINNEAILPKGFDVSPRMNIIKTEDETYTENSQAVDSNDVLVESNVNAAESMFSSSEEVNDLIDKEIPNPKKSIFGF